MNLLSADLDDKRFTGGNMEEISKSEFKIRVWKPADTSLEKASHEAEIFADSAKGQGFNASSKDILAKMANSDINIDFIAPDGNPAAFASLLAPSPISFGEISGINAVYANGLIVDQQYARRGLCKVFLRVAGDRGNIVVAHTQNPIIVAAFRKVFPAVWPSTDGTRLDRKFAQAIARYLKSIERPQSFDTVTGLVRDLYAEPLYAREFEGQITGVKTMNEGGDATLVIGFGNEQLFAAAVEPLVELNTRPSSSTTHHNEREAIGPLDSLVIGGGPAALRMHVPCINKAAKRDTTQLISGKVTLVERDPSVETPAGLSCFRTIAEANVDPENTVVHVATGPADRPTVVREAAEYGFKFFILEKPLASCRSDLEALLKIIKDYKLKVVVNFPWLSTPLTRKLKRIIDSGKHGKMLCLTMIQEKSRHRTVEAAGHKTAFDIETPHQVSLALYLAGMNAQFRDASCKPLVMGNGVLPAMGGAFMLLSQGHTVSDLRSDLDARVRDRHIELFFEDGWQCWGSYPASGDDDCQRLWQYDQTGNIHEHEKFFDDPLSSLFLESYRNFLNPGSQVISTLDLAVATSTLISKAKRACGLEVEPIEPVAT